MDARIPSVPDAIGATSPTGHVADLPDIPTVGTPHRRRNDERNPSLVRPRALGLEHRRCRYAYGALRHFAKRILAVPRIPATTGRANEVSARWNGGTIDSSNGADKCPHQSASRPKWPQRGKCEIAESRPSESLGLIASILMDLPGDFQVNALIICDRCSSSWDWRKLVPCYSKAPGNHTMWRPLMNPGGDPYGRRPSAVPRVVVSTYCAAWLHTEPSGRVAEDGTTGVRSEVASHRTSGPTFPKRFQCGHRCRVTHRRWQSLFVVCPHPLWRFC